jgi:hypothetical protein
MLRVVARRDTLPHAQASAGESHGYAQTGADTEVSRKANHHVRRTRESQRAKVVQFLALGHHRRRCFALALADTGAASHAHGDQSRKDSGENFAHWITPKIDSLSLNERLAGGSVQKPHQGTKTVSLSTFVL